MYSDDILVVDTVEAARALEVTLRGAGGFALDTETVGCNPKVQSPVLTARCWCWSVAWVEPDAPTHPQLAAVKLANRAYLTADMLAPLKALLEDGSVAKCMHNGDYDVQVLANHGITVRGLTHDTKHSSRFWYSSKDVPHDLKSQMSSVLGYNARSYDSLFSRPVRTKPKTYKRSGYVTKRTGPMAGVPTLVEAGTWDTFSHAERELIPLDDLPTLYPDRMTAMYDYASLDAKATIELAQYRKRQLRSRPSMRGKSSLDVYQEIWQPMNNELRKLERAGITVDPAVCAAGNQAALLDAAKILPNLHAWVGDSEFNFRSPDQLKKFLFGELGLPRPPIQGTLKAVKPSKNDEWSTSEVSVYWLELHCPEHANELSALRRWRKVMKAAQYLRDLPEYIATDGRVHCVLSPEADTGRLSAKNPALQQIPSNDEYGIRRSFVAAPDHKLIVADMSQLEVYVLAHVLLQLFNDSSVYDALQSGDVYSWIARAVWPELNAYDKADFKTKGHPAAAKRALAKILVLASNYGKTPQGIALSLLDETGEPADEQFCKDLLDTYYGTMPGVTKWHTWSSEYAAKHGGIYTLLGRWRPIPYSLSDLKWQRRRGDRQAMNTPIQGGAMDLMSCALLQLAADPQLAALGARCLLQIHDELIFEVPEHNAEAALPIIVAGMENPPHVALRVKLRSEAKIADCWQEGK